METTLLLDRATALLERGERTQCTALCLQAMEQQPVDAASLVKLERLLRHTPHYEDLEPLLFQALAERGDDMTLVRVLARVFMETKRLNASYSLLQELVAAAPLEFEAAADLVDLLIECHEVEEAEQVCRLALAFEPDGHVACRLHNGLARSLWQQGRPEAALDESFAALKLAPTDRARFTCQNNIAAILQSNGKITEMRRLLTTVLTDLERWGGGGSEQASILFQMGLAGGIEPESEFHAVLRRLATQDLHPAAQADVQFALARLAEKVKDTDTAMACYIAGGKAKLLSMSDDPAGAIDEEIAGLDQIRATFTPELVATLAPVVNPTEKPIFIVGMPRSGTTLIEQVLASNQGFAAVGELQDIILQVYGGTPFAPVLTREGYPHWVTCDGAADVLRVIAGTYLYKIERMAPGAKRIIDKMPANFLTLGVLAAIYPNARFIHSRRAPLDNCIACFTTLFTANAYESTYDLAGMGRYYRAYESLMNHWHRLFPGRILDVHYEDMVTDLEGQSRRMMDFLGLPWDASCLSFHEHTTAVRTASFEQVRRPVFTSSVGRWKTYGKHIGPLIDALGLSDSVA